LAIFPQLSQKTHGETEPIRIVTDLVEIRTVQAGKKLLHIDLLGTLEKVTAMHSYTFFQNKPRHVNHTTL
jgi:hypothetical protein